ncbi:MAG: hypothetical protein M9964_09885 [Solirubrobacterales bacterium]|nr:hypothetical protein [Solirubrobacterales bacterium]
MDRIRRIAGREDGQAAPEYAGVVLLVATLLSIVLTMAGSALPGGSLARALASKLVCAVGSAGACGEEAAALDPSSPTEAVYGIELAAMLDERAPEISFEPDDFVSLPVDYRECRNRSCADSIRHGSLEHTQTGLEPTVFTHVIDCRDPEAAAAAGYDCSGERAGNVYLQYWLYYPDSATHGFGASGYHEDDWEGYQVKVDPETGQAEARASSHHGYNGRGGDPINDVGITAGKPGWDSVLGHLHVAAGSHAGMTERGDEDDRWLAPPNLRLIPLEPIAEAGDAPEFEITPPWGKGVWSDPEATGT